MPGDYDGFAWLYNDYWHWDFHQLAIRAIEGFLLPKLPAHARVLDVCCGTGRMAQELSARGFEVTGLDRSEEMLRCAKRNAPGARFLTADASRFALRNHFHATISTFDSMNHILSREALQATFQNVHDSLLDSGYFLFDLNLEEQYLADWDKSCSIVEDTHAYIVRGGYDPEQRIAHTAITMFRLNGNWQRSDVIIRQRCYSIEEVKTLLLRTGFQTVGIWNPIADAGWSGSLGRGRAFLLAMK